MPRHRLTALLILLGPGFGPGAALAADPPAFCQRSTEFVETPSAAVTYPPPWVAEMAAFLRANCPAGSQVRVPNRVVAQVCDLGRPMEQTRRETTCVMAPPR